MLIRHLNGHLATLRAAVPTSRLDLALAERIAAVLRRLVVDTARSSAADRARVRAAVHFFAMRRESRNDRRSLRPLAVDLWVVNEIVGDLGRLDLVLAPEPLQPEPA